MKLVSTRNQGPNRRRDKTRFGWVFALLLGSMVHAAESTKPEILPKNAGFPDPLVMQDGRRVTSPEMWRKERRPELIRLFQHDMTGTLPPKPGSMTAEVLHSDRHAFDGKAT